MWWKSILGLSKLIFGEDAYFIAPANKKLLFNPPKSPKMNQIHLKMQEKHKLGKMASRHRLLAIFYNSWDSQGNPKKSKNEKNAFQKSIEKKEAKKEAIPNVRGRVPRPSRGQ